ncbi:Nickel uptake substrate-specific transmembrane region [Phycisphaerae bacterium RAS2]|nr:Nickel uptake substrate-specific transmembrane region [Phycisphaerae bacterium RAS2]
MVALTGILCGRAAAHEYWIQPATFQPTAGREIDVNLFVGDGLPGEPRPRDNSRLIRFDSYFQLSNAVANSRTTDISGDDGGTPAGRFVFTSNGLNTLTFCNRPTTITLEPDKFEAYLREDGMEHVIDLRKKLGESTKPGREAYSRCAKALVAVNGDGRGVHDVRIGLPLEIIPLNNPYRPLEKRRRSPATTQPTTINAPSQPSAPTRMTFQLVENGRPAAGALMAAIWLENGKSVRRTARTDSDGKASFELSQPGMHVINAVRMTRARGRDDVDWESTWSSLTFELP